MKIGIVTLIYSNDNYGGTLQAYALQSVLRELGHSTFFVNCDLAQRDSRFSRLLEHPVREIQRKRRYAKFVDFWRKNIAMDPNGHRTKPKLFEHPTPVDAYVCGSDQIWADGYPNDEAMRRFAFADFGPRDALRVAYAPGWSRADIAPELKPILGEYLRRFSSLSAREQAGGRILRELGFEAENVLDPTLLPDVAFWHRMCKGATCVSDALFVPKYRWKTLVPMKHEVRELERAYGMKVLVPSSETPFEFPFANRMMSPEEWIATLSQARFVLTNSFHAAAFSIVFHRPFGVMRLSGRYDGMNMRFTSLLSQLGLSDRIISERGSAKELFAKPIDWASVDDRLSALRVRSMNYLKSALQESR